MFLLVGVRDTDFIEICGVICRNTAENLYIEYTLKGPFTKTSKTNRFFRTRDPGPGYQAKHESLWLRGPFK